MTNDKEIITPITPTVKNKRVENTASKIIDSFNAFLQGNDIAKGAIAISYNGQLVGTAGKNRTAKEPARLASLSKAITAVCVVKALEKSNYSVHSTLQEIIPAQLRKIASGVNYIGPVTIEQLITHTSGIRTKHMSLQGKLIRRYDREQKNWQLGNILKHKPAQRNRTYYYSNANYLVLGMVIEKITNTNYESYCNNRILKPLNILNAKLSPRWRILSSYAGWELSALDYLRFANTYFSDDWKSNFSSTNNFIPAFKDDREYGLGVWMRKTTEGIRFWHSGSITWNSQWQNARFASFFASYENGFSVSLNYSRDSRDGRGAELQKRLYQSIISH